MRVNNRHILADIQGAVRRFAEREFNWDGHRGLKLRPDVYGILMDAVNAPWWLVFGDCEPEMKMLMCGVVTMKFWPPQAEGMERYLKLTFVDGSTILWTKRFAVGSEMDGVIHRPLGGEQHTREELDELFDWLHREEP